MRVRPEFFNQGLELERQFLAGGRSGPRTLKAGLLRQFDERALVARLTTVPSMDQLVQEGCENHLGILQHRRDKDVTLAVFARLRLPALSDSSFRVT